MDIQDIAIRTALDEYIAGLELPSYAVPFEASPDFPMIRYAKGVNVVSGRKPMKYTGWHIGIEQSAELDSFFESMGVPVVRVKHLSGNEESYWQLDSIKGYILCKSVPSEYGPNSWQKTGIAHVWNEHKDSYSYGSQLQCLFFMKGLLELGYTQPLVLSFSRTVTEHFIQKVLRRQEAFLEAIKRDLRKHGKVANLASYAYWLTLAKSEEEATTKGGGSYCPPIMVVAPPLTVEYVQEHQADPAHLEIIESFVPMWDAWAQSASQRLMEPPRDNETRVAQQDCEAVSKHQERGEADPTIIISGQIPESSMLALYNAIWQAKQRGIRGGLFTEEAEWWTLLSEIGIAEFTQAHIGILNKAITALLDEAEAS